MNVGRWDWHKDCYLASAGAGAGPGPGSDAAGLARRQRYLRWRHRQQFTESSRRPADSRGAEEEDQAKLLVCRGWEKFASGDAGGASAGVSTAPAALVGASSPSPQESWPWFKGCGDSSLGLRCRGEPESQPPRNMFLTTTHRRGNGALAPPA